MDAGVSAGIIKKAGSWFSYGEHKFQGRENAKDFFAENPDLREEIEEKIKEKFGLIKNKSSAMEEES